MGQSLWNVCIFVDFVVEDIQVGGEVGGVEAKGGVVQLDGALGNPLCSHLKARLGSKKQVKEVRKGSRRC